MSSYRFPEARADRIGTGAHGVRRGERRPATLGQRQVLARSAAARSRRHARGRVVRLDGRARPRLRRARRSRLHRQPARDERAEPRHTTRHVLLAQARAWVAPTRSSTATTPNRRSFSRGRNDLRGRRAARRPRRDAQFVPRRVSGVFGNLRFGSDQLFELVRPVLTMAVPAGPSRFTSRYTSVARVPSGPPSHGSTRAVAAAPAGHLAFDRDPTRPVFNGCSRGRDSSTTSGCSGSGSTPRTIASASTPAGARSGA